MQVRTLVNQQIDAVKTPIAVLLYYQFAPIADPKQFVQDHKEFCLKNNLKGRIIVAKEGINGTCAGNIADVQKYMDYVHTLPGFEDLWFKVQYIDHQPFPRMSIKEKPELVALGVNGLENVPTGKYVSPKEAHEMYERSKTDDSIVFFDARSDIEAQVGRFPNAIVPPIRFFRDLPKHIKEYEHLKDKKIVMYCTGGIRCEKATKLFHKAGFENLYHIEGGIYNYCTEFPDGHFKGSCYVFDDRMAVAFNEANAIEQHQDDHEKIISRCFICGKKTARVVNDERQSGRVLVVCCEACDKTNDISRIRYKKKQPQAVEQKDTTKKVFIASAQHYYPKAKIAQAIIEQGALKDGDEIIIEGSTTKLRTKVAGLRVDNKTNNFAVKGDIVTFASDRVRPSDKIYKVMH